MSVLLQLVMGVVAIASGSTVIGVVACSAMAFGMWAFAVSEIVAFYRVGLPQPEPQRAPAPVQVQNPSQLW